MPELAQASAATKATRIPEKVGYPENVGNELPARLVTFLVTLPLCLAISLAFGAPMLLGSITGIVGGVLVSWLSGFTVGVTAITSGKEPY